MRRRALNSLLGGALLLPPSGRADEVIE